MHLVRCFVELLLDFLVEDARLAAFVPEVPHAIEGSKREDEQELSKPEARVTGQLLEITKVVERRHAERDDDDGDDVENDASGDQANVAWTHLVGVHQKFDVRDKDDAAENEVSSLGHVGDATSIAVRSVAIVAHGDTEQSSCLKR